MPPLKKFFRKSEEEDNSLQSLVHLINSLHAAGKIDNHITHMLKGVLSINDLKVRDLMVPRAHIDYFYDSDDIEDIIAKVLENGHSRYPVLSDEQESIGLLFSKDLLKLLNEHDDVSNIEVKDIIKPIAIIPESKRVITLLQEFQTHHRHLALVVNEFGEISGLITIEDILEEIVGEISDEFDKTEVLIHQINKTTFDVLAVTDIEDFNKVFGTSLDTEEFDTIGGYIINTLGHVPQRNESFELASEYLSMRVIQANTRAVLKIRVRILPGKQTPVDLKYRNISQSILEAPPTETTGENTEPPCDTPASK